MTRRYCIARFRAKMRRGLAGLLVCLRFCRTSVKIREEHLAGKNSKGQAVTRGDVGRIRRGRDAKNSTPVGLRGRGRDCKRRGLLRGGTRLLAAIRRRP